MEDSVSSNRPLAINETEGLAIALERVMSHVYNSYPDARNYIAEAIEWYDDNQERVSEQQSGNYSK